MTADERFVELWNDYLEGELGQAGIIELRQLLAANDGLLKMAADSYKIHRLLGLLVQDGEARHEDFVQETLCRLPASDEHFVGSVMKNLSSERTTKSRRTSHRWSVAIAAAALVLAGVYLLSLSGTERRIAKITQLSGSVQWTGDGGQVTADLDAGQSLSGGTLESLSADSWAELEFRDGSTVTISGLSSLTVSEQERKELHLQHGRLSANVAPQPLGKPMRIFTRTAELEVLGTQFNVDAESSATTLAVNEGVVRLKRLTDGKVVEVSAEHQVYTSIDEPHGLTVTRVSSATNAWRGDLTKDVIHGKWASDLHWLGVKLKKALSSGVMTREEAIAKYKSAAALNDESGVLNATPWLVKHWKAAKKADVSYLAMVSVARGQAAPVILAAGGEFRIQGHVESSADVTFGITTNAPGGGFAGKYSVVRPIETSQPDGVFDIKIPLRDLRPVAVKKGVANSPAGEELADWWCLTKNKRVGLAITHVELLPPASVP